MNDDKFKFLCRMNRSTIGRLAQNLNESHTNGVNLSRQWYAKYKFVQNGKRTNWYCHAFYGK